MQHIKIFSLFLALIMAFGCLMGCSVENITANKAEIKKYRSEEYFGTTMTITLYGTDDDYLESLLDDSFAEIKRLEDIFSAKLEDSELTKLNNSAYGQEVKVSEELYTCLSTALKYNKLSDGALDVSIGNIINLWAIGTDNERVPEDSELDNLIGINGCQYIKLNDTNKTVTFTDSRVRLDLGAVAKGYAADIIKKMLKEKDPDIYGMLNFGGNVMTIGTKKSGDAWVVGITNPRNTAEVCSTVTIKDKCVVTSGDYQRYFERNGVRYHHILDASTGYPSKSGIISATVVGESSIDCDALSTSCFILGVDKAMAFINGLDGYEAFFVMEDGSVYKTDGMADYKFVSYNQK